MKLVDTYRHKGMRKKLVETLAEKGIEDSRVLAAIDKVPRHFFLDAAFLEMAYSDKAFQIGAGQTISQPYTVAYQSQLLEIKKGDKILEIGTGSGYQASILAEMGVEVHSIERQESLYRKTRKLLPSMGYSSIKVYFGDGFEGLPDEAPFDKIIITAGAKQLPDKLITQLRPGGFMVIPFGDGDVQTMYRITKQESGELLEEAFDNFKFVPMLKGKVNH